MSKIKTLEATKNIMDFIEDNFRGNPELMSIEAEDYRIEAKFSAGGEYFKIILLQVSTNDNE